MFGVKRRKTSPSSYFTLSHYHILSTSYLHLVDSRRQQKKAGDCNYICNMQQLKFLAPSRGNLSHYNNIFLPPEKQMIFSETPL